MCVFKLVNGQGGEILLLIITLQFTGEAVFINSRESRVHGRVETHGNSGLFLDLLFFIVISASSSTSSTFSMSINPLIVLFHHPLFKNYKKKVIYSSQIYYQHHHHHHRHHHHHHYEHRPGKNLVPKPAREDKTPGGV